jgi:hypothetical protein
VAEGLEQRRHELAPGQVAGAAEEDEIKSHGVVRRETLLEVGHDCRQGQPSDMKLCFMLIMPSCFYVVNLTF